MMDLPGLNSEWLLVTCWRKVCQHPAKGENEVRLSLFLFSPITHQAFREPKLVS
jgi:hypothetical protein